MTTRNIVPRSTGEGGIGTSSKYWESTYVNNVYSENVTATGTVSAEKVAATGTISAKNVTATGTISAGKVSSTIKQAWNINDIEVIAHRGFATYGPENTLIAFEQALSKYGADAVEFDMQMSSDGVPILMHDTTVDRTTDGTGNVSSLTLAELQALDAGSFYSSTFSSATVPKLEDAIKCVVANGIRRIYAEIKGYRTTADIATMVNMFVDYNLEDKVTFNDFTSSDFAYVRAITTKAELGFVAESLTNFNTVLALAVADGNAVIFVEESFALANTSIVTTARDSNVDIVAYTVSDTAMVNSLLDIGITRFVSNKRIGVMK